MAAEKNETFGLIKTLVDAHTAGIHAAAALLRDCGYRVLISPKPIEYAMERIASESYQKVVLDWINENNITRIGFSYRLDPDTAVELMADLFMSFQKRLYGRSDSKVKVFSSQDYPLPARKLIKNIRQSIDMPRRQFAEETLLVMGVPLMIFKTNQGRVPI